MSFLNRSQYRQASNGAKVKVQQACKYCPACNRDTPHQELYEKNGCPVSKCSVCGLGRAAPAKFDPHSYYNAGYFNGSHSDGYLDYAASEQVLRQEFVRVVNVLAEYCPPGAHVLEIGCAFGFFLKEARRTFKVSGIEIAADAVAACHAAGLDLVHQGEANEETLANLEPVDAIVMLDVVEHLADPVATLGLCSRMLKPGGVIILTTGNFASPLARLTGKYWRLMTPPQHLWYFTPESLRKLAAGNGMQVEDCSSPWKIVPLSLIFFQIARMIGLDATASNSLKAINKVGIPVNLFDAMRLVLRKQGV